MSIRQNQATVDGAANADAITSAVANTDATLGEGNSFHTADAEHPLTRSLVVSIKASLNDLCLQGQRATWKPTQEAARAIFQQRRFTSLDGSAEPMGDLKSIVLHGMDMTHVKSTFPCSLGARVTGVDDSTYTSTGEPYSTVILPNSECNVATTLQADDVSLAYEFAKKFPGYTSANLDEKGVHSVSQRRFVLVAADHPIVSAISENADRLQMGEISMMPEGLVKISQTLYDNILPLVKTQVESQIKVRDLSRMQVHVTPAEYGSWQEARADLVMEAKKPLKAQMQSEIAAASSEDEKASIRTAFLQRERALEHEIDHRPMDLHMKLGVKYNFLSK